MRGQTGDDRAVRSAWLEIDLDAIAHNLRETRKLVGPKVGIIAIAKCNAYGHGAVAVVRRCVAEGAEMIAVALLQEAVELREAGIEAPLLVLGAADPEEAPGFVKYGVTPTVTSVEFARALSCAAEAVGRTAPAHVKIDSGMGRQGLRPEDLAGFGEVLRALPGVQVDGVFSHFACAPGDCEYTAVQARTFASAARDLESAVGRPIGLRHVCNTGGILQHSEAHLDAVRPGALLYGIGTREVGDGHPDARPAMSLKARIVFTKCVRRGDSVGYNRTFVAERDTCAAILPLGYGDGYPRTLSNNAEVLVHGTRCPVVGLVSMDCTVVDVSAVPRVQIGDEAVLLGAQGEDLISAGELAQRAGTVVQEIVARMSVRLPRVYKGGETA